MYTYLAAVATTTARLIMAEGATDLFEYDGKHYLIAVDYFSCHIELVELRIETAEYVIVALKKHMCPSWHPCCGM